MRFCPQSSSIVRTCPAKGQHTQSYTLQRACLCEICKGFCVFSLRATQHVLMGVLGILWHRDSAINLSHF